MADDGCGAGVSPAAPGVSPANGTPTSVGREAVPEAARALPDESGVPGLAGTPTSVGLDWAADESSAGGTPALLLRFAAETPAPLGLADGTHCPTRLWTLAALSRRRSG